MKKLGLIAITFVMLFAMTAQSFAAEETKPALPTSTATIMSKTDVDAFFSHTGLSSYKTVYDALSAKCEANGFDITNNVFGMEFTADEPTEEQLAYYGLYFADFELVTDEDATIILLGAYESYQNGTPVMLGVFDFKKGEPQRIMQLASEDSWKELPYSFIKNVVKDFKCIALPVTTELCEIEGVSALGEKVKAENAAVAETNFTLSLNLYETENVKDENGVGHTKEVENGESWQIGNSNTFTYHTSVADKIAFFSNNEKETVDGKNYYPISIYGAVDSLKYKKVGFNIYASNTTTTDNKQISTDTVYTSVKNGENTVEASELGGAYIFGGTIYFSADGTWTNDNTSIEITPFVEYTDGTTKTFDNMKKTIKKENLTYTQLFNITEEAK